MVMINNDYYNININDPSTHGKKHFIASEYQHLRIITLPKYAKVIDIDKLPFDTFIYK